MSLTFQAAKNANPKFGPGVGALINRYIEATISSGKWAGSISEFDCAIHDFSDNGLARQQITLPREFLTPVGAKFNLTQGRSNGLGMQFQWFSYMNSTRGSYGWWNSSNGNYWHSGEMGDMGDGFVTFRDLPSAGRVKVYTTAAGESGNFSVRGYADGERVFTGVGDTVTITGTLSPNAAGTYTAIGQFNGAIFYQDASANYILFKINSAQWILQAFSGGLITQVNGWTLLSDSSYPNGTYTHGGSYTGSPVITLGAGVIEGENIPLPSTVSSATSATIFDAGQSLYGIVKPITNGVLTFYHVAADLTETLIGRYEPGETAPSYRRFSVPNSNYSTMRVAAKRRFVPLIADNDLVIPENGVALTRGLEALHQEDSHGLSAGMDYWAACYEMLNSGLRENQGNFPRSFQVRGTTSFGDVRPMQ